MLMKLINANKHIVTIEFTSDEFSKLHRIISTANQQYNKFDIGILNLSKDEVRDFNNSVGDILDDYVDNDKHLIE